MVAQTLSKSRSLAGLRVGFALGQENLIAALRCVRDSINSYTVDRIAKAGAAAALAAGRELREVPVEEIRSLLRAQGAIVPEI